MRIFQQLGVVAGILFYHMASAQQNYPPAPAAAPNMVKAEYYIDTDPGVGKANDISIAALQNIADKNFPVSLSGLAKGAHFFYLRSMDAAGRWSHLACKLFTNFVVPDYGTAAGKPGLVEAEYFIDTDPGFGNALKIQLGNRADIANQGFSTDITGLTQGIHLLHIRTKDATGKWSINAQKIFNYTAIFPYPAANPLPQPVIAAEAFIDTDPGFGNGIPLSITAAGEIAAFSFDLPVTGLSVGPHHVFVRAIERPWSITAVREFVYGSVVPLHWLYFKGEEKNNAALLQWGTTAEVNTASFNVQHSTDGMQFITVANLPAAPQPGEANRYSFQHNSPVEGFNFYRIQQVDNDGKFTYSASIRLLFKKTKDAVTLAPNPVFNESYIIQNSKMLVRSFSIFNSSGHKIRSVSINALKDPVWSVDLRFLQPGVYSIRINYQDRYEMLRFIKK